MQPGYRVGQYELLEVIGRGGMGEVWRAHDTRLERDVALKTLPAGFAADANAIARLMREARLLATLNHPNIAAILGLEEQDALHWLVLELVEGPTLEDRLVAGRKLALQEAIAIVLQVAEALQAAHSRGIIHCDLKPSNIKLSTDGRVRVLDFGIARSLHAPPQSQQTTLTALPSSTEIAGTPVYMSPEQTRGEPVGPTSDIWAFGVLLYRMLAGRVPFSGPTAADTAAQVLQSPPDLSLLRPEVPESLIRLLRRCLEKEPRQRIQHAGDLRILIEEALVPPDDAHGSRRPAPRRLLIAIACATALVLGTVLWFELTRGTSHGQHGPIRAELSFERGSARGRPFDARNVAITRDGARIAVATGLRLWIRTLGAAKSMEMDIDCMNPFFSPDGAWLGCFNDSGLVKIPTGGGDPVPLAPITERTAGAVWTSNGAILLATSEGMFRVSDAGGKPELIVRPDAAGSDRQYAWPELLPGERSLLLTVLSRNQEVPPRLVKLDLRSGKLEEVLKGGSSPRYLNSGVLLYASGTRLLAVRWDARSRDIRSEPVALPDVQLDLSDDNGTANYAVSANGTLVTLHKPADEVMRTLYWRDAHGTETPINVAAANYTYPRVSPDGKRVALDIAGSDNRDIWTLDLERNSLARMTTDVAEDALPVWSSDGHRVFFSSNRGGDFDIYSQAADASDAARKEVTAPGPQMALNISPDGGHLVMVEDFRRLSVFETATGSLRPLLSDGAAYWNGSISPDGNWIAYESNESGERVEIFLRPFPAVKERREKISIAGGRFPVWGPPGSHALYYLQTDGAMMRAALRFDPALQLGAVTRLFDWYPPAPRIAGTPYDVSRLDGRFLLFRTAAVEKGRVIHADLVFNWFDELQRFVPE